MIPNTIGASRRWQLDCAVQCWASLRETCLERSEGWAPLAGTGVRGKAAGLARPSAGETRSAIRAPLRTLPIIRRISFRLVERRI